MHRPERPVQLLRRTKSGYKPLNSSELPPGFAHKRRFGRSVACFLAAEIFQCPQRPEGRFSIHNVHLSGIRQDIRNGGQGLLR